MGAMQAISGVIGCIGLVMAGLGVAAILVGGLLTALLVVFDFDPCDELGLKFLAGGFGLFMFGLVPFMIAVVMYASH